VNPTDRTTPTSSEHILIVSPMRNEAKHLGKVIAAMAAQTRPPDEWIVVDDGSDDGTPEILERASAQLPFLRVLRAPVRSLPAGADRLSHAAAPRVFNFGIADGSPFTHVGKLDGDIELPSGYFEALLDRFRADPELGIAGGVVVEQQADGEWRMQGASHLAHVRGALRLYSQECFETVGGVREVLGWDGIDVVLAHMHGYRTQSFVDLVTRHHRPTGSAQGRLRGHLRWGRCQYIQGYPAYWTAARALKVATTRPRGLSGIAYLAGYVQAALKRVPRFEEPGYRAHLRGELRARAVARVKAPRLTWLGQRSPERLQSEIR
jgi:biofilm PGA synthesis N-glycosyltransferase PgaC